MTLNYNQYKEKINEIEELIVRLKNVDAKKYTNFKVEDDLCSIISKSNSILAHFRHMRRRNK